MLIDTHAHLDFDAYNTDRDIVIKRAISEGIQYIIAIGSGNNLESGKNAIKLAEQYDFIYATVGIHPHDVSIINNGTLSHLRELASYPKVVAIGEIGLDFHYENSPRDIQIRCLPQQILLAREFKLPVIIHDRDSHQKIFEILKSERVGEIGGVMHCFSGNYGLARACIDLGLYISISGVVTFKNAKNLHDIVKKIPIENMVIETDSPYLAPHPFRGKRNEPANVKYIAESIADLKQLSFDDVARITSFNAKKLFNLGEVDKSGKITYAIRDSLYLNITNRCTNACVFCPKFKDYIVKGHYLKLRKEPSFDEIIGSIGDTTRYKEVVFCGFGEPTLRLDMLKDVAKWLKEKGVSVRLDTDGLANLVHGRSVLPELEGIVDSVSVSLNAPSPEIYSKICLSKYHESAYEAVKNFIMESKKYIPEVIATVVAMPDIDIEKCREVAEKELGVKFRIREYNEVG